MTQKLHFDLVSPERRLASKEVYMVVVPGDEGDFAVLANHAPFMSGIRTGVLQVYTEPAGVAEQLFIEGGFAEVNAQGLTILAQEALPVGEIDAQATAQQIGALREALSSAASPAERTRLEARLARLQVMLKAAESK
jgi:F-type H+-transporting ATPase subunit epsilon